MRIDRTLLASSVAVLIGSVPLHALACIIQPGLWVCGYVEASYDLPGQPTVDERIDFEEEVTIPVPSEFEVGSLGSLAHVRVEGGPGWARIFGNTWATLEIQGNANAGTRFTVAFSDELTITSPGASGNATVTLGVDLTGVVSSAKSGFGSGGGWMSASFDAPGVQEGYFVAVDSNSPELHHTEVIDERLGGDATIVLGVPFTIVYWIELAGSAGVSNEPLDGAGATWTGDLGDTVEWAGLSNLRDELGNPITEYEVTSLSGTDYRHPVPEPAPTQGTASGLAMLGLFIRRRACSSSPRNASGMDSAESGSAFRSIAPSNPSCRLLRQIAATAALVAGMICAAPASAQSTPTDLRLWAVLRAEDYTPAHIVDFLVIDEPLDGEGNYSFAAATAGSLAGVITQMDYGWTRVVGNAAASKIGVPGTSANSDFMIEASTTDQLTIDLPGIANGTPLTIEMGLHLEGGLSAAGEGDVNLAYATSHGNARLTLGAETSISSINESWPFGPIQYDSPGVDPGTLINDDFSIDVTFADGIPFELRYRLYIEGYASMFVFYLAEVPFASATGTFVGDFGHTLTWAGLSNLRDELGQPLDMTDMEVSSVSGVDYRNPIIPTPEPGPIPTLSTGLVALAGLARSRSRGLAPR